MTLVVLTVGVAWAETPVGDLPVLLVDKPLATPCQALTFTGQGFAPGGSVTITSGGTALGTASVEPNGAFSFPATVPCTAPAGDVEYKASDGATTVVAQVTVKAAAPAKPDTSNVKRRDPVEVPVWVENLFRLGVILLGIGGIVWLAVQRREREST